MFVSVAREDLAQDLWAYGEDELAVRALEFSDLEMGRIGVVAGRLLLDEEYATPSGASMFLAKACAMAAVEVIEGERRPLKRKRRRSVPEPPHAPLPPPPPGEEKPRDVFLAACAELASRFEPRGFRYAKSGPHISRRQGEFTEEVAFASSHYNVAGQHVDLTLYAGIRSKELRRWRVEHRPNDDDPSDHVAGGMLQNLGTEMPIASWELADPSSRPEVLDEIGTAIEEVALPYFALFEDGEALVRRLQLVPIPSFYALSAIEWLLARNESDAALAHARLLLNDDRLRRQYERIRKRMESGEMELVPYVGEAEGLAYAALAYGLAY